MEILEHYTNAISDISIVCYSRRHHHRRSWRCGQTVDFHQTARQTDAAMMTEIVSHVLIRTVRRLFVEPLDGSPLAEYYMWSSSNQDMWRAVRLFPLLRNHRSLQWDLGTNEQRKGIGTLQQSGGMVIYKNEGQVANSDLRWATMKRDKECQNSPNLTTSWRK